MNNPFVSSRTLSPSSFFSAGSSIRDLITISVAAITMNSPAMSRLSRRASSMNAMYSAVMRSIGMS